ncbi:MAG: aspartate kinase [Hadesarchaea archaeon]|nr:aspartate kinase [Hadesarchaea archaeon]
MKRIVAKFGGTSIGDGELLRKAAKSVRDQYEAGNQVIVIVSAMGSTTDVLLEAAEGGTQGETSPQELDEILSMGEKISARAFASTLRSLGVDSKPILPEHSDWPVITDNEFGNATPDLEKTRELTQEKIIPLLENNTVPVICGFVGKNHEGDITTLGRGGSDITAFLIGKCAEANEVIIVTDAEGVMSADPRRINDPEILEEVTADELCDLARYGARILHRNALSYKDPDINARIIHFQHGNLSAKGTTITGEIKGGIEMNTELYPEPLAMLTVVGEEMQTVPGILIKAINPLSEANINIFGVSIGPRSFSLYTTEKKSQEALEILHDSVENDEVMKSATNKEGVAMIVTESEKFIDTPGIIRKLSKPLAENGINVLEIYSSQASISFFLNWEDREEAFELLKKVMKEVESK